MAKQFGFKEWQLVCDALEAGEFALLIRKGGISEGKRGFQWLQQRFFFFPTWYHGQQEKLRRQRTAVQSSQAADDPIEIRLWAELVATFRMTTLQQAPALASLHPWNDQVVDERFHWGEEKGLSLAIVRVFRLRDPWLLTNRESFGGCRSWLGLPDEGLPPGWRQQLERVTPEELIRETLERCHQVSEQDILSP